MCAVCSQLTCAPLSSCVSGSFCDAGCGPCWWLFHVHLKRTCQGFPGGVVVKYPPANAGDTGSSPGPGRSHMLQSK